jgi:hypothetical protein
MKALIEIEHCNECKDLLVKKYRDCKKTFYRLYCRKEKRNVKNGVILFNRKFPSVPAWCPKIHNTATRLPTVREYALKCILNYKRSEFERVKALSIQEFYKVKPKVQAAKRFVKAVEKEFKEHKINKRILIADTSLFRSAIEIYKSLQQMHKIAIKTGDRYCFLFIDLSVAMLGNKIDKALKRREIYPKSSGEIKRKLLKYMNDAGIRLYDAIKNNLEDVPKRLEVEFKKPVIE